MAGKKLVRATSFMLVVEKWLEMRPCPVLSALVNSSSMSLRQLQRNCNKVYGISPKRLARRTRALRAAEAMGTHPNDDYDIVKHGFYDQSHMIREIKEFTGLTPGQIRRKVVTDSVPLSP